MSSSMPSSFRGSDEDNGGGRSMYDGSAYGNMFHGNNGTSMLMGPPLSSSTNSTMPQPFYGTNQHAPYSQASSAFQQQPSPSSTETSSSFYASGQQRQLPSAMMATRYPAASRLSSAMDNGAAYGGGRGNNNNTSQLSHMTSALNTSASASMNNHGSVYGYNGGTTASSSMMYGSSSDLYHSDAQYRSHQLAESSSNGLFGGESAGNSSSCDHLQQQAFPTTLNDYYLAQQQQLQQQHLQQQYASPAQQQQHLLQYQQQQASLFGIMTAAHPKASTTGLLSTSTTKTNDMFNSLSSSSSSINSNAPRAVVPTATKPKKRRAKTFPEKLMKVLMEHNNSSGSHDQGALAWLPDGKSFIVINPDTFVGTVLNKGFKASKYASFVRKLHRWGFVRLTSGTGTDCFHHPLFVLGDMDQVGRISCATTLPPSSGGRTAATLKPPTLAGVERFIRAKVAEAANKTFQETIDMRRNSMTEMVGNGDNDSRLEATGFSMPQQDHAAPKSTSALTVNARNTGLNNSSVNPSKADIGWGKDPIPRQDISYNPIGVNGIPPADFHFGKGALEEEEEQDVAKESASKSQRSNDLVVSPTGAFSPRPFPSSDIALSKKSIGIQQHHAGRFFNMYHEAKPSGLEELAMVANGLREQSMHSSSSI